MKQLKGNNYWGLEQDVKLLLKSVLIKTINHTPSLRVQNEREKTKRKNCVLCPFYPQGFQVFSTLSLGLNFSCGVLPIHIKCPGLFPVP